MARAAVRRSSYGKAVPSSFGTAACMTGNEEHFTHNCQLLSLPDSQDRPIRLLFLHSSLAGMLTLAVYSLSSEIAFSFHMLFVTLAHFGRACQN